jgi:membrane protein
MALVLVGYLLVLAPRIGVVLHEVVPDFDPAKVTIGIVRYPAAFVILGAVLFMAHLFLPARRTAFSNVWPGVLFTLALWTLLAGLFSYYLRTFASYTSYYAGLAGIVATLYFMYLAALILIFGGEFNRAIRIRRLARAVAEDPARQGRQAETA